MHGEYLFSYVRELICVNNGAHNFPGTFSITSLVRCRGQEFMVRAFTDMIGKTVEVEYPPKRIISLVPSQTELLYDLGLRDEVVGITKFCVHPEEWFRSKKRVGGTKTVHLDMVKDLEPGLIIANKEENTREQIETLCTLYPTWVSDIHTADEALQMILEVGLLVGKAEQAADLVNEIKQSFVSWHRPAAPKRVAYFIWRKPWMCAGGDTFISDMIGWAGWVNVLADRLRYPEITLEELKDKKVDIALLSSEPYPFKEAHIAEIKAALPQAAVMLVDGELFSWYGSRMRLAAAYIGNLTS